MKRSQIREHVFILVFMTDFNPPDEMRGMAERYFETREEPMSESSMARIREKYLHVLEKIPEIDAAVNEKTENWSTSRMGKTP